MIASLAIAAAGCGDDDDGGGNGEAATGTTAPTISADSFPAPQGTEDGKPAVAVSDEAEAQALCNAAQANWPEVFAETGADAITFDIPGEDSGEDSDLICARVTE